jgi:hypothetical protein
MLRKQTCGSWWLLLGSFLLCLAQLSQVDKSSFEGFALLIA